MEKVDCVRRFGSNCFLLTLILGLATLARVAALVVWQDDLQRDPDGYLDVAHGLVAGDGFVNSTTNQPTAARPPLYPVLLSIVVRLGGGPTSLGVLQLVLGVATVWLVYLLGKQLGTSRMGLVAAGVVAVYPLLLKYTAAVMTETLFVFLTACLLLSIARCAESPKDRRRQAFVGTMFGLTALCRPTIWPSKCSGWRSSWCG
jgi:4-amino-4-deoxy-L-arabinose transferase-like glycosyltransferase